MRTTKRNHAYRAAAVVAVLGLGLAACDVDEPGPSVSFEQPETGATVDSPVTVEMAAEGVTVEPAANGVNEGAGHFHVIIDGGCVETGQVIPNDDTHLHFGDGATSAEIELEPGDHELCLQFAGGDHVASALTDTISVRVAD